MNGLLEKLLTLPELRELAAEVHKTRCCAAVTGLSPVHRAMVAAALAEETKRPLLLLCADEKECARQAADVQVLLGVEPVRLPERELQLRPASYSRQWENARLSALYRMAQGDAPVVVATPAAMVQRCLPRETLLHAAFSLEVGGQYDVAALCSRLIAGGYTRTEQVEGAGQFALRGGILDVFSPGEERPLRCEFFDDELDSMGEFEVATQRRVLNRQRAHILPAGELLPFAGETTAADAAERMEEAARRLGRAQPTVANKLRLLRLPEDVRALLRENGLTERHARALLRLQDPEVQRRAAGDMVRRGMNVAQAEAYVEKLLQSAQVTPPRGRSTYIIKDVRLFLNSVDRGLHLMRQAGVDAGWNRQDTDREILLTIRIPKRASGKIDSVSESC